MTFAAELQQAARALERHRPDGACDAECGCVTEPAGPSHAASSSTAVLLSTKPAPSHGSEIACTLSAGSMRGRIGDWQALLAHVDRRERIDGGLRCVFDQSVPGGELMRVVTAEQSCCQFFAFAITVDSRGVGLDVRGPDDARAVIDSMFGVPA
jgi:MerR family transcriptional regulator, copper efflux regulator